MKRLKLIIICLCMAFCLVAQTQQIIVKTKARIDSTGQVIPGKPLSGVTVRLKGVTNAVVTKEDGRCSIRLNDSIRQGAPISVISVQKKGYQLADPSIIRRVMAYSSTVPITIVMVSIEEYNQDKMTIERRARRRLRLRLQAKEEELDSLRGQEAISDEEYLKELRKLYDDSEKYENLIGEMADRYALTDFDQASDLDFEILQSIINEDEIQSRIEEATKKIEEAEYLSKAKLNTYAHDLYRLSELYRIELQYDSAVYYLERRADLDTLNAKWNLDVGKFILDYLFFKQNEIKAKRYFDKALQICLSEGEKSKYLASTYTCLGDLNYKWGNYKESLVYFSDAFVQAASDAVSDAIFEADPLLSGGDNDYNYDYNYEDHIHWQGLERIAHAYISMSKPDSALSLLLEALSNYREFYPERKDLIANCYINIGVTYEKMDSCENALENYKSALAILDTIYDMPRLAYCYNNLGSVYERQERYGDAIESYNNSLNIYEELYGPTMNKQLDVAYLYNNLASAYYNQSDYEDALKYYIEAFRILGFRLDKNHPTVRTVQENIRTTIVEMSN